MINHKSTKLHFLLFFLLISLLWTLMTTVGATSNSENRKLIFGDDINYPPFSYLNERGQPSGFNVELAKAIGKAMGYEVQVRLGEWSSIREALKNGEIDAISGMVYSDGRTQYVDFSSRYLIASGDIFTKSGEKLSDIKNLKNQTVIVQKGDFVGEYLKSLDLNIQLVEVSTVEAALLTLKEGTYQYAGLGKLSALYTMQQNKITGITAQGLNLATSDRCMAVNRGNEKLLLTLNSGLQVLKATGEYDKIYERCLGVYADVSFTDLVHKYRIAIVSFLVLVLVLIGISLLLNQLVKTRTKELEESNNILYKKKIELETLITDMKKLEAELNEERNLFKTTLHSLGDAVISIDKDGNVDLMNAVAEELTGWKNAKGVPFETVFHIVNEYTGKKCPNPVEQVFETGRIIELANHTVLIKKNGDTIPIEDSASPIKDETGNINGVVLVFRDFTDKKEKQEQIRYLSHHDQLTGLYNRHYFEEQLILLDIEENLPFSVAMADVNGLKLTNDAFGHRAGDALLKRVANIIKKECRADDIVARVGGDEFVLLLPKTTGSKTERIVKRINATIAQEKQANIIISVSFGWDTKTTLGQSIDEVLNSAEEHMYRKKLVESQSMRNQTIKVIMQTLLQTNIREQIHSEKVSQISRSIGEAMQLDIDTLKELETAALMHDIGKIAINENVLNKAGPLTGAEYEELKRHPEIGYHILKSVDAYSNLADYVLSHHECWDGTGYPRRLAGGCIPLIGRIIAVADSFEAMIGERTYRSSMNPTEAAAEIKRCSETQFDPDVVRAFFATELIN